MWETFVLGEAHGGTARGALNEILQEFDNMVTWRAITYTGCPLADVENVKRMKASDVYLYTINDMRRRTYEYKDAMNG